MTQSMLCNSHTIFKIDLQNNKSTCVVQFPIPFGLLCCVTCRTNRYRNQWLLNLHIFSLEIVKKVACRISKSLTKLFTASEHKTWKVVMHAITLSNRKKFHNRALLNSCKLIPFIAEIFKILFSGFPSFSLLNATTCWH